MYKVNYIIEKLVIIKIAEMEISQWDDTNAR